MQKYDKAHEIATLSAVWDPGQNMSYKTMKKDLRITQKVWGVEEEDVAKAQRGIRRTVEYFREIHADKFKRNWRYQRKICGNFLWRRH